MKKRPTTAPTIMTKPRTVAHPRGAESVTTKKNPAENTARLIAHASTKRTDKSTRTTYPTGIETMKPIRATTSPTTQIPSPIIDSTHDSPSIIRSIAPNKNAAAGTPYTAAASNTPIICQTISITKSPNLNAQQQNKNQTLYNYCLKNHTVTPTSTSTLNKTDKTNRNITNLLTEPEETQ